MFSDPLAFNVETMRKLAPALVDGQNYFGVWPFEGDELKIWGITAYEGDTHLQIIDPGRIILRFRSTNIAALTGQSVRRIDFERMITDMRRLCVASEMAIAPIARRIFYLEALFWLLSRMRSYCHGGTVLFVVPGQSTWVSSIKQPIVDTFNIYHEA